MKVMEEAKETGIDASVASLDPKRSGSRQGVAPEPMDGDLAAGQVLDGRFRILALEYRSGMASIYRAEDLEDAGRQVALKVPLLKIESDSAGFSRFVHEEEVAAKLSHPGVIKVYPPRDNKCRPYMAMEYLSGQTLAECFGATPILPEAEALRIASLVAEALEYIHAHGVIHRDLKPENIMLCDDGTLRLFDFGLASAPLRHRNVLVKLTPIFGTPEYMAPEQVEHGAIDERTDLYALGAILYRILTGEVPWRRDDGWESAFARLNGDAIAPRKLNPAISPEAEEIVLHALHADPADRYQSAAAFKAELDAPERVIVTGRSERLRAARWRPSIQGTPMLAGVLMALGVFAALVALFFFLYFGMRK